MLSYCCDYPPAPIVCNNSGSVAVPQKNIMTVKGESIVLQCLIKGNLKILETFTRSLWEISSGKINKEVTYIADNSTDPYRIAVYQSVASRCEFVNKLIILNVSSELDNLNLTCTEIVDTKRYSHSAQISKCV